MSRRWQMVIF